MTVFSQSALAEGSGGAGPEQSRAEVYAANAMAATSQPLATQVALEILRAGGSAIDAAIAANACLGLMEPTGCGVGGDLFAIVWDPSTSKLVGYNGSGRSPRGLTLAQLKKTLDERKLAQVPASGPLPVTVPGCVDGWFALHERFGKLPMEKVLAPAVRYALEGFPLSPAIADAWARSVARFSSQGSFPNFREQFTIEGRAPGTGELWKNPALASTLELIGREGRDAFYRGSIARRIGAFLQAQGGFLTADDFASHQGEWVDPVSTRYRGHDVWELPPNGQGIAALQILNILEGFDLRAAGFGSAAHVHLLTEAKKLAFEDRARFYADPAFSKGGPKAQERLVERLISKSYASERRKLIKPDHAARSVEPGSMPSGADTIYLATADSTGMMVSLIQSNYRGMGSGMVPGDAEGTLGFMLQNRGEQFALDEQHPNAFAPGKRPFHTIIPAFITKDSKPWIAFGVMGGAMQPQGHAQIVINLIDFGMNLQQAGDAPRIHHDGSTEPQGGVRPMNDGGVLNLEPGFDASIVQQLLRRGHRIQAADTAVFGGYQAIMRHPETGVYVGATEKRKDGSAAGY
ncbi:MAG: gamma-glutamyltransferase [Planctomycetota bacterium]|nr:gamma-glutamyltransferase [Planctomycetota bacterium]